MLDILDSRLASTDFVHLKSFSAGTISTVRFVLINKESSKITFKEIQKKVLIKYLITVDGRGHCTAVAVNANCLVAMEE